MIYKARTIIIANNAYQAWGYIIKEKIEYSAYYARCDYHIRNFSGSIVCLPGWQRNVNYPKDTLQLIYAYIDSGQAISIKSL